MLSAKTTYLIVPVIAILFLAGCHDYQWDERECANGTSGPGEGEVNERLINYCSEPVSGCRFSGTECPDSCPERAIWVYGVEQICVDRKNDNEQVGKSNCCDKFPDIEPPCCSWLVYLRDRERQPDKCEDTECDAMNSFCGDTQCFYINTMSGPMPNCGCVREGESDPFDPFA